jgi:predicted pyridoxine 5'-phosphate oxidase superfamily flavin-nucleotide-binding protein
MTGSGHDDSSPFHVGERAVQQLAGVPGRMDVAARRMIRDQLPDSHREFFAELPFLLVGSLDARGRPWASILTGEPGFVHSPEPHTLSVHATPLPGDPLSSALRVGGALGLLGIELETRRRNRLNGHLEQVARGEFSLRVDQSFGNCPQYITARVPIPSTKHATLPVQHEAAVLSAAAVSTITAADTCFIASASSSLRSVAHQPAASSKVEHEDGHDTREGVDVSHRGGNAGFVLVQERDGASVLTLPDFAGNNMFNTLGNLARYPRAGLLFPNFASGDLLQVTGSTEIVWQGPELSGFRGAARLVRVRVEEGLFFPRALPFVWSRAEAAAQLARTGNWSEALDDTNTRS